MAASWAEPPNLDHHFPAVMFRRQSFERFVQCAVDGVADQLEGRDMGDAQPRAGLRPIDAIAENGMAPVPPVDKADQAFGGRVARPCARNSSITQG